ncbi:MAG: hypothetical protein JXA54_16405 [Candidatus Heimdallarchaeota archaeon]|nr:hypothetical protein [Candidatus Heimdallarchaeota archaeon]
MTKQEIIIENGIGLIKFEKTTTIARMRNPLEGFKETEQKIEYRRDPLTNHWSRINKLRAERVIQASVPSDSFEENLQQIVKNSAQKCFFCPENIIKSTPKLSETLNLGERITIGDFTLFPNLFVFSEYHAVGTLGKEHFTRLHEFPIKIWKEALQGSIKYFKAVHSFDPSQKYPSINFNFLPTSASSIIHPHIQVIQDAQPTKYSDLLFKQSEVYSKRIMDTNESNSSSGNYWLDLIASEKIINERFIKENDFIAWIATFSPTGKDEIMGILKNPKTDITLFTERECELLAYEITTALKAIYFGRGATAVNMAIFIGPIDEDISSNYRIIIKIVSRPTLVPNYTGDIGFMELLHSEPIAAATPEIIANTIKPYFNTKNN